MASPKTKPGNSYYERARQVRNLEAGRCRSCGLDNPRRETHQLCAICGAKHRESHDRWAAKCKARSEAIREAVRTGRLVGGE